MLKMLHLSSDMVESRLATLSERLTSGFAALANNSFYAMTGQQWNTDWASKCHTLLENAAHACWQQQKRRLFVFVWRKLT